MLGPAVQLGRDVATAAADRHRQLEPPLVGQVGDLGVRIEDLEVGGRLDVAGSDRARAALVEPDLDLGRLAVELQDEILL